MSVLLKQIKSINQIDKDIVIGYIKNEQKLLTLSISPNKIPMGISYLCILFYYEDDCFNKDQCAKEMEIDETNSIVAIKQSGGGFKKALGAMDIFDRNDGISRIYSWTFKILDHKPDMAQVIYIGIDSNDKSKNESSLNIVSYALGTETRTAGFTMDNGSYKNIFLEWKYGKGDEIKMELNMEEKTLRYWINNENIDCVLQDIDFAKNMKYNMCVCAAMDGLSLQLLNFEKVCHK